MQDAQAVRTISLPQFSPEDTAYIQGLEGSAQWDPHKVVKLVVGNIVVEKLDQRCLICDEASLETRTARVWEGPQGEMRVGPNLQPLTSTGVESHTLCTHCGVRPDRIGPKLLALLGQS